MFVIYSALMRVLVPAVGIGGAVSLEHLDQEVSNYLVMVVKEDATRQECLNTIRFLLAKDTMGGASVPADRLSSVMKAIAAPKLFQRSCVLNSLPIQLGSLAWKDLLHVYYLELHEQKNGWTCGYWAPFNAAAVNAFLENRLDQNPEICLNELISSYTRRTYYADDDAIRSHIARICQRMREKRAEQERLEKAKLRLERENRGESTDELPENAEERARREVEFENQELPGYGADASQDHIAVLIELLQIPNIHILVLYPAKSREQGAHAVPCYFHFDTMVGAATRTNSVEELTSMMLGTINDEHKVVEVERNVCQKIFECMKADFSRQGYAVRHFCCFFHKPEPHWYLVSLIKLQCVAPFLIILDSYNFTITDHSDSSVLLEYLYKKLLVPLRALPAQEWVLAPQDPAQAREIASPVRVELDN